MSTIENQEQFHQEPTVESSQKLTDQDLEQVDGGYAKKDYSDEFLLNGKGSRMTLSKERMYNEHVEE